ncbi:MAG: hypothetical protein AAB263_22280 [Planctomycetota bacterium]
MIRLLGWLVIPLLIISCHGDKGQQGSSTYSLDTQTIELSGSVPTVVGVLAVLVDGVPATIVGNSWHGSVVLTGPITTVTVTMTIDGTTVATRLVDLTKATIPAHQSR